MEGPEQRAARFHLRCWGARGTAPSPGPATVRYGGNTSCIEVRTADGEIIVLDAGTGIRALGKSLAGVPAGSAAHLFLSHRHSDHVMGLPHYAPLFARDARVSLWCGNADAPTTRVLVDALLSPPLFVEVDHVASRVAIHEFTDDDAVPVGRTGTVRVTRHPARHPGDAAVFLVSDEHGPAVAYAPDNELCYEDCTDNVGGWRNALIRALHGVRLLVHDAMYRHDELSHHTGWGHSSAEEATRFAVECGAERLLLFHHHPDRSDDELDEIVEDCRAMVRDMGSRLQLDAAREGWSAEI